MKVKVLQIVWHNKEPVFSLDFHPTGLLATGGADSEIKLWSIKDTRDGSLGARFLASITGDPCDTGLKTWNCVRFCPTGQSLAATGDMGQIYVWRPAEGELTAEGLVTATWKPSNCGAYSAEEVMHLDWAADGSGFVTASNDMTCMFWDPEAKQGKAKLRLEGHKLYVQGVAWDPHHQFIVSQGADRCCRVYSKRQAVPGLKKRKTSASKLAINRLNGLYCAHVIHKSLPPKSASGQAEAKERANKKGVGQHLFHDESMTTFFRRLAWSPDGSMLVVPAGLCKPETISQQSHVAYVFARGCWHAPLLQLPAVQPVVAVRFCPIIFELTDIHPKKPALPIDLPYRMVFAIATKDSVVVYDTQTAQPLVLLGGLHMETITDLAWAPDARLLAVSSRDGYCSVAHFEEGELGQPIDPEKLPSTVRAQLWASVARRYQDAAATASASQKSSINGRRSKSTVSPEAGSCSASVEPAPSTSGVPAVPRQPDCGWSGKQPAGEPQGSKQRRRIAPVPVETAGQSEATVDLPAPPAAAACRQQNPSSEQQAGAGDYDMGLGGLVATVGQTTNAAE